MAAHITFDHALRDYEHWRVTLAGFSVRTWAGEKPGLLAFADFARENQVYHVGRLSALVVHRWWEQLNLAEATKGTRLSQLRSFLGYCQHRGWMKDNPTALLRAPQAIPAIRERLNATELLRLIEVPTEPRDRALIALCANLALRGSEIRKLTLDDVRLDDGEIHVTIEKTQETDVMPISADLDAELRSWLTHYYVAVTSLTKQSFLIPSRYVEPATRQVFYRHSRPVGQPYTVVQDALRELGWEQLTGEGVHTIRRSVARIYFDMAEADESFDEALLGTMTLLHHSRPETTLRYIGRDRRTLARDRVLKGKPFLTRLAGEVSRLEVAR